MWKLLAIKRKRNLNYRQPATIFHLPHLSSAAKVINALSIETRQGEAKASWHLEKCHKMQICITKATHRERERDDDEQGVESRNARSEIREQGKECALGQGMNSDCLCSLAFMHSLKFWAKINLPTICGSSSSSCCSRRRFPWPWGGFSKFLVWVLWTNNYSLSL